MLLTSLWPIKEILTWIFIDQNGKGSDIVRQIQSSTLERFLHKYQHIYLLWRKKKKKFTETDRQRRRQSKLIQKETGIEIYVPDDLKEIGTSYYEKKNGFWNWIAPGQLTLKIRIAIWSLLFQSLIASLAYSMRGVADIRRTRLFFLPFFPLFCWGN